MIRALYTAASGMNAQQANIDTVAHNLANVNTAGFKKSHVEFEDLVYQEVRTPGAATSAVGEAPIGLVMRRVDLSGDEHRAAVQDVGVEGRLETGVHDDAQGLAFGGDGAHVELRVVVTHGADAGEHRTGAGTPAVGVAPGVVAGDPLGHAVVERGLAVERGRGLEAQPRPTADHARDETDVEFAGFGFLNAGHDIDARVAQQGEATTGDQRVRVFHRGDDTGDAGLDQCFGAGRGAAVVGAGFEGDVGGCAAGPLARHREGVDFGMGLAGTVMPAFTDHFAVLHDHAADAGIGCGGEQPAFRQFEGAGHPPVVVGGGAHGVAFRRLWAGGRGAGW